MFINFFVHLLHLENYEGTCDYVAWYEGNGLILGAIIPFITSLVFVLLFYYVIGRKSAVTTIHWCLFGVINMIVSAALNLFIGRASLGNYILSLGDEYQNLWYNVTTWPFSTDLWMFALNGAFWALVFFFLLSVALKKWSPVFNIPFGKKYKKAKY